MAEGPARGRFTMSARKARDLHKAFALLLASLVQTRLNDARFEVDPGDLEVAYAELLAMLAMIRGNNNIPLEEFDVG